MTASPLATSALQHPAFQGLSPERQRSLEAQFTYLQFRPGQSLCDGDLIPDRVLLILEGEARLLAHAQSKIFTLAKIGKGGVVGLASLLRVAPCEHVSASLPVVAASLQDDQILDLYKHESSFRQWFQTTLFPAEVAQLLEIELRKHPGSTKALGDVLIQAMPQARLVPPQPEALATLPDDLQVLLASANAPGHAIGERLDRNQPLPAVTPPLGLRLIALPRTLLEQQSEPQATGEANLDTTAARLLTESGHPQRTSLSLGQSDPSRQLQLIRGRGVAAETLACFQMLTKLMGLPFRRDAIEKSLSDALRRGQAPSLQLCGQLAANLGLHVAGAKIPAAMAGRLQVPSLIPWGSSFALVTASNAAGLRIASPADGWVDLDLKAVEERYPDGLDLLILDRTSTTRDARFDFSWFWPAIRRHRAALLQVLVASFVVQLFTLANPLLIQVIIDKVISQRSLDTLQVLGFALLAVTLLEGVLSGLRTFLFTETTNRIDLRLGAEVIDHLLRLPLAYFDHRPVGELSSRMAELEKIRNFLTGQALTTFLDAIFAVIYIVVMLLYSWLLTLVALFVLPIQVGITILGAPLFRRQYRKAAEENAKTQAHLVEVLNGIQTVKAQNVEMVSRWKWQEHYSAYIARTFEKTVTGTTLNETSQVLQKISQLLVLWIGASMVLQGQLTLGQLIAFRIISGYVTQPLLRLSTIWQNVQELRVSFERLADVVDTPQESNEADQSKIPLPPIHGSVRFENVSFSFQPGQAPVLKHVDLDISEGTFVGVVGQSGSGKSTLMKLLSRLYSPTEGRILIDGTDIDKVELYSLRRQIGIVPQDPLLFAGTVSDNIAIADPEATNEAIVQAATAACAHDFIMELPSGYSTPVGERGSGVSGGQRQRIAIARTLLNNPKLLVMDEATSALDYDTERRVFQNLRASLKGCTVFFITHRLTTIRNADKIVMMDQGSIVESGTHVELMAQRGRYFALYRQQEAAA